MAFRKSKEDKLFEQGLALIKQGDREKFEKFIEQNRFGDTNPSHPLHLTDKDNNTLFHHAALENKPEMLKEIARYGACDVNHLNNDGSTALHIAIDNNHKEAFDCIMSLRPCRGSVDLNARPSEDYTTPLIEAYNNDRFDMALKLLEEGANPNLCDEDGMTVLHNIAWDDDPEWINFTIALINHPECDVNKQDNDKETALHLAVREENIAVATLLLGHPNINPNIVDEEGQTALYRGVERRNKSVFMRILEHPETALIAPTYHPDKDPLRLAVELNEPFYIDEILKRRDFKTIEPEFWDLNEKQEQLLSDRMEIVAARKKLNRSNNDEPWSMIGPDHVQYELVSENGHTSLTHIFNFGPKDGEVLTSVEKFRQNGHTISQPIARNFNQFPDQKLLEKARTLQKNRSQNKKNV